MSSSDISQTLTTLCAPVFRPPIMSSKRKSTQDVSDKSTKREKNVMTLVQKVEMLNKLASGMGASAVGKIYGVNESTVRYIKKTEHKIRKSVAQSAPASAKVSRVVRDGVLVKTENALSLWIEDMSQKNVPLDQNVIRAKALSLYELFHQTGESVGRKGQHTFTASKGWFEKFKKRSALHYVKLAGDAVYADHVAAGAYPAEFLRLVKEKGYKPEQVFNADETALWWKKMPPRTVISKHEKRDSGFKFAKDRVTLLLCGNAAGFMVKPMLLYRIMNPRALKGKDKHLMPVYFKCNTKAWMTAAVFLEWFHNCFVRDVEKYLQRKGVEFKVLLVLNNAPGHPKSLEFAHPNVEVVFLPTNTTFLIQPLDQGIVATFKAYYLRRVFEMISRTKDDVRQCWTKYNIADCIANIKESLDELKPSTVNACWAKLWKEAVNDSVAFPPVHVEVGKIVKLVRESIRGEGFGDLKEEEVMELLDSKGEELTEEDLEELVRNEEDDESDEDQENSWNLDKMTQVFQAAKTLTDLMFDYDPSLERSLETKRGIESAMSPYSEMYKEMQKKAKLSNHLKLM